VIFEELIEAASRNGVASLLNHGLDEHVLIAGASWIWVLPQSSQVLAKVIWGEDVGAVVFAESADAFEHVFDHSALLRVAKALESLHYFVDGEQTASVYWGAIIVGFQKSEIFVVGWVT